MTYPNPTTPQYIIEVKHRLGQLKKSSLESYNLQTLPSTPPARPTSASSQKQQTNADDQHRFFDFERRQTPDALRAARYRLDKHRYNPSLDQLPIRPKTAPVVEPSNNENAENQQIISEQTTEIEANPIKTDAWANENDEQSQTSFTVQVVDCDGLPPEYAEALKTAAVAQEEYQRTIKSATGRNSDRSSPVVRPPPIENQIDSVVSQQSCSLNFSNRRKFQTLCFSLTQMAYQQQLPTSAVNNNFGSWVRNATDKGFFFSIFPKRILFSIEFIERASAMKILQEVLNQPIVGYDPPNKKKSHLKTAPAPPPVRAASATRKLGRTRTQHRFPCEICEKLLIKRHVWDLSRFVVQPRFSFDEKKKLCSFLDQ